MVMGLKNSDARPLGVDLREGYTKIRRWYQANVDIAPFGEYGAQSRELISGLKATNELSENELKTVLWEVIAGLLEWGYHGSDGKYKMGAYAHVAIAASDGSRSSARPSMH
jgi:hypothetical protein